MPITFSVESHANCSSLPNPDPTFPCSSGFCLLGGHGGGDPLNPQVGSFTFEQFISNIPFYYSHNGDALSEGLLLIPNCTSTPQYFLQVTYFDMVKHIFPSEPKRNNLGVWDVWEF